MSAIVIGAAAALPSYLLIALRSRLRFDDSLDVVAAHGVGGLVGALLTGVFAQSAWGGTPGLIDGAPGQLWPQLAGILGVAAYSGVASFAILKVIALVAPLRAAERAEGVGLDVAEHGEEAYSDGEGALLVLPRLPGDAVQGGAPAVAKRATG